MNKKVLYFYMILLFCGCNSYEKMDCISLELYNNYDVDLYIYLNVWNIEIDDNNIGNDIDNFGRSRNLIVNKLINSNLKVEFNEEDAHFKNSTITLSQKEPVFIKFNRFDSLNLSIEINEEINDIPNYIQLISFTQKDMIKSKKEFLVFHKKTIRIDLTESLKPFEEYEILDSINIFGYYDSLNIIPIELKLIKNEFIQLNNNKMNSI